jgi:uncharacterized protein YndB with AHSA1/START domain
MADQEAGSTVIARPIEEVFEFVADPRNDPRWCERVQWCRQVRGEGPAPDARYEAQHRPSGFPWSHLRRIAVVEVDPPRRVRWEQRDQLARFDIAYELEAVPEGTLLTQRDEIHWRIPGIGLVGRRIVRRHIGEQHEVLRTILEGSG